MYNVHTTVHRLWNKIELPTTGAICKDVSYCLCLQHPFLGEHFPKLLPALLLLVDDYQVCGFGDILCEKFILHISGFY